MNTFYLSFLCIALASGLRAEDLSQAAATLGSKPKTVGDSSGTNTLEELTRVLKSNYRAMQEKKSELALSYYHPKTNLITTKEELDQYLSQTDVTYTISNVRFIGNDAENYVIIYREVTEFRRRGETKLSDKEDSEVLMVFRRHEGKFKIFSSKSLKPGA